MNRVLFIIPPYVEYNNFVHPAYNDGTRMKKKGVYKNIVADMPLGVLSISAYVKKHIPVEIKLIDFNIILNDLDSFEYASFVELFRDILESKTFDEYAPDIIAISTLFTPSYYNMLDIADMSKRIFINALIIAGGGVPTSMYKEIFEENRSFDALCFGEGEKPFLALLQAIDKKECLKKHDAWVTREAVNCQKMFRHDFIENLDEIPFFDYELLGDISRYRVGLMIGTYSLAKEKNNCMSVMISRGCTHHCCFCASHLFMGE